MDGSALKLVDQENRNQYDKPYRRVSIFLLLNWAVWTIATTALFLFIRHYARNVPYIDDWSMVPLITGCEPVSLKWAWSQHNEHRVLVPKLILAGLFRGVSLDLRSAMYLNAGLLSMAAAMMLVLARGLRGRPGLTDVVLPLSILSIAQYDCLLTGFALNLVLTALVLYALIAIVARAGERPPWMSVVPVGVLLLLLPLCGGSGLVVLPPLIVWLTGYLCWGWWSGENPDPVHAVSASCASWDASPSSPSTYTTMFG